MPPPWASLFGLLLELWLANVAATQLDVEHPLHGGQDLLVGRGCPPLEVGDDCGGSVALGGEVLLGHLGLHLLPCLRDHIANLLADRLGLDNVIASVDLGQVLTLNGGFGCLQS